MEEAVPVCVEEGVPDCVEEGVPVGVVVMVITIGFKARPRKTVFEAAVTTVEEEKEG